MHKIKILNIIRNFILIILMLIFGFVATTLALNVKAFSVATDSMAPEIRTGDVVFIRPATIDEINENDIVTIKYNNGSGCFTHRVVKIDVEKGLIYTKGDKNSSEDPLPASKDRLIGKLWFSVAYIGQLSLHMSRNTLIIIIAAVIIAAVVVRIIIQAIIKIKAKK